MIGIEIGLESSSEENSGRSEDSRVGMVRQGEEESKHVRKKIYPPHLRYLGRAKSNRG